jgi:hypothetical protein
VRLLGELGVLFLLFEVGLEVRASELLRMGRTALGVAGVITPLVLGWWLARLWGEPHVEAWFIGTAMVATSVGVIAQVLAARGLLAERASRVLLAAGAPAGVSRRRCGRRRWARTGSRSSVRRDRLITQVRAIANRGRLPPAAGALGIPGEVSLRAVSGRSPGGKAPGYP